MSNFIPLTGSTNIVDQIIQRFQDVPGFDFIEYTDAQGLTGELFRELIGPDFEPYKDLGTYAEIEAVQDAIDLVNASANAQQIIAGITESVTGFVIDEPTVNAYIGNDGFILLSITNAISTPEASALQYRIDGGGWQNTLSLNADTIDTTYVVIPDLDNNTTYTVDVRQSLFGTQSKVKTLNLTTTPTVNNWNSFFVNTSDRDYFYTDSYTNNNTYGVGNKTVMEMIFGSAPMFDAIYADSQTIGLVDQKADNLSLIVSNEESMLGLANSTDAFEYAIATPAYITAIDNVDLAVRILILEQTATQDYTNFTNVADFIDDQNAMAEVAASTDAMRALIASANALAEKVIEPIALNEVFDNEQATLIVANNADAVTEVVNSTIAMGVLDTYDLALRVLVLEQTNQDYTQFANFEAVASSVTAMTAIAASQTAMTAIAASQTAIDAVIASQTAMTAIAASQTAMTAIANSTTAFNEFVASQTAMTAIEQNDLALRILVLEQTNQDYTQFANFEAVASSVTATTAVANATNALTATFASGVAREAFWDSEQASGILMDANNTSRQFIDTNFGTNYQATSTGSAVTTNPGVRGFVLSSSQSYRGPKAQSSGNYSFVQPGNGTVNATGTRSDRVSNLTIISGSSDDNFFNKKGATRSVRFVEM